MNMLHVFQQRDRECVAQLILVVVQDHQGEQILLRSRALPNTVFLVGNALNAQELTKDMLPDLLLLDVRLSEVVKSALTRRLCHLYKKQARVTPLIANVCIDLWQATNKEREYLPYHEVPRLVPESLLAAVTSKNAFTSM